MSHVYLVPEEGTCPNCAGCGREFDSDDWELVSQAGDAWGGSARYSCPDCDSLATVLY